MISFLKSFHHEEEGAVTVDWVVITGGIVLFAVTLGYGLRDKTIEAGDTLGTNISALQSP